MSLDATVVATRHAWDVARLTPLALQRLERLTDTATQDGGFCPDCALTRGSYHVAIGVPLEEAVATRLVDVSSNPGWASLVRDGVLFIFCPYCTWWGIPSEAEVVRLRNLRSQLRPESR